MGVIRVACREHSSLPSTPAVRRTVFPGLFALQNEKLRDLLDVKVFVDEDSDIRLARRLKRDISERNREMVGVLKQYNRFVKPSFDTHIKPTAKSVLRHAPHCFTLFLSL